MSKSSSTRLQWCKLRVKRTPDAKYIAFWSLTPTRKNLVEVPHGTPSSCHVVVKKCTLLTWHDDVAWWHGILNGMMMWYDDMACWCGMMTWHDDVAWWHGMMTSMHSFVLEMSFRTFMHLLMRNCKTINIWSEWKNYSHITHLFIPWVVMKLMRGCNQKQTCHICKEVVTSWFII